MNPVNAYKNTVCGGCGEVLEEGEKLFLTDDGRFCEACAEDEGYICGCGKFKKQEYEECYECHTGT